jgi:glycerophosphoryl diester phosphodiesterase
MEAQEKNSGFDAMMQTFKYANCIQTNYPGELLAYLKKKGLHR